MGWKNVLTPNAGPYAATVSFNPEVTMGLALMGNTLRFYIRVYLMED
jgi:hypothetical protein